MPPPRLASPSRAVTAILARTPVPSLPSRCPPHPLASAYRVVTDAAPSLRPVLPSLLWSVMARDITCVFLLQKLQVYTLVPSLLREEVPILVGVILWEAIQLCSSSGKCILVGGHATM
ncbi:hypothetical protein ZEAMMB73_Zm00001d019622 [Zea mays]|uniref:Uncharacterized protein n=1 Tax=Zea mays TaxID=4577 RepID=A0A1D6HZB0_MAIZE|nr:hypothetical protein ZEAMMB73_Zm00001d019622 [Zea mays]